DLSRSLRKAYFQDALNIAEPDVLATIASTHGFDPENVKRLLRDPAERDETLRQAATSRAQGVISVPFFVFGGIAVVAGQQDNDIIEAIQNALTAKD
ncbi:DsbA family oxidoreductase, partial [Pseudomonas corrugata]